MYLMKAVTRNEAPIVWEEVDQDASSRHDRAAADSSWWFPKDSVRFAPSIFTVDMARVSPHSWSTPGGNCVTFILILLHHVMLFGNIHIQNAFHHKTHREVSSLSHTIWYNTKRVLQLVIVASCFCCLTDWWESWEPNPGSVYTRQIFYHQVAFPVFGILRRFYVA